MTAHFGSYPNLQHSLIDRNDQKLLNKDKLTNCMAVFEVVVSNFLGNNISPNYVQLA